MRICLYWLADFLHETAESIAGFASRRFDGKVREAWLYQSEAFNDQLLREIIQEKQLVPMWGMCSRNVLASFERQVVSYEEHRLRILDEIRRSVREQGAA